MKNTLEYKGYFARIEYSVEDQVLFGKIEGIKDLVNFEGDDPKTIEQEFHNAVDDYLALCAELGQDPDKPYSGTFNIRIDPSLHRAIAMAAKKSGESLNAAVETAIRKYIDSLENDASGSYWSKLQEYQSNSYSNASIGAWAPQGELHNFFGKVG